MVAFLYVVIMMTAASLVGLVVVGVWNVSTRRKLRKFEQGRLPEARTYER